MSVEFAAGKVFMSLLGSKINVVSTLEPDKHEYTYFTHKFNVKEYMMGKHLNLVMYATPGLDLCLVVIFLDQNAARLSHVIMPANNAIRNEVPAQCEYIKIGIRVKGPGHCLINSILGDIPEKPECFLPSSDVLLLTNNYPQYYDLYRNAFVHRRIVEYKNMGVVANVFLFNSNIGENFYEFHGIDVIHGFKEKLDLVLQHGEYKTVLVHFLDSNMWEVLRKYTPALRILVWIHGAEIQPWWRRKFNYETEEQKQKAIKDSEVRMNFWKQLFLDTEKNNINMHYIFVSKCFADDVIQDIGITISEKHYSVIHNFIDTSLFKYEPKSIDQRLKILSIRPYVSRTYANDLSVKAILELSKKPFFNELAFRMIGDGCLFDNTVEPLKKFPNVTIEKRFLTQEEISRVHKEYGIFLVPTRMDSQGVSRDEAMSSGLVPVTNKVAAIPEFVDDACGILAPSEDYIAMAEGIERLYKNPELFLQMSGNAAEKVRKISAAEYTITKEIKIIKS